MTCVSGHLTQLEFGADHKDWKFPPPERLFEAPVYTVVPDVRTSLPAAAATAAAAVA